MELTKSLVLVLATALFAVANCRLVPVPQDGEETLRKVNSQLSGKIKCKALSYPGRGYSTGLIPGNVYSPGQKVTFHCLSQYEIVGDPVLVCLQNGHWSGSVPTCKLAFCKESEAEKPIGGGIFGNNRVGDIRGFMCDRDRRLIGPAWIRCQEDGTWSGKPPACTPYCDEMTCSLGTKCEYDASERKAKCVCLGAEDCSSILNPVCGSNGVAYDNRCLMKVAACSKNIAINVVSQALCQKGQCNRLPSPPENSEFMQLDDGSYQVLCNEGFYRTGNPNVVCDKWTGAWKFTAKCHRKSCGHPGDPKNGKAVEGLYQLSRTISYTCNDCFYLDGPKERTCLGNQTWSGDSPVCRPIDCGRIRYPENGFVVLKNTFCGSSIEFHCNDGYELQGSQKITCQEDRMWSDRPPRCVGRKEKSKCHKLPLPPDNSKFIQLNNSGSYQVLCNEGFYRTGNPNVVCDKWTGAWKFTAECHRKSCGHPGDPKNGKAVEGLYQLSRTISYTCIDCFYLDGPKERTCLGNQTWSGESPVCRPIDCGRIRYPENGFVVLKNTFCGSSIEFHCNDGYELQGSQKITCQKDRMWSDRPPRCVGVLAESLVSDKAIGEKTPPMPTELPSCPPNYTEDLCNSVKRSDVVFTGKKLGEDEVAFHFKINEIKKDSKNVLAGRATVQIAKILTPPGCENMPSRIRGSVAVTAQYSQSKTDGFDLVMTGANYLGRYYGPKQFRCK